MTTFGMTENGFVPKRMADVLDSITTKIQAIEDPNTGEHPFVNESADSIFGQFSQILSEEISICWEAAYLASQQFDPLNATGVPLRGLVQLNGITPSFGSPTQISMTLSGTNGTVVPAGSLISNADGSQTYATVADAVIGAGGTATVNANCTEDGPNDPAANTIISIQTPVFGWNNATNTVTNSVGTKSETDEQLHIRQQRATSATSYRQVDAIISGIMNVEGVQFARLYVNQALTTDAETGLSGKTMGAVVVGGTDEDIANVLRLKAGSLDNFEGTTSVTFTGELGDTQVIKFYRPTNVPIYVSVNITIVDNGTFPLDGIEQIQQAIVEYAKYDQTGQTGFPPGADVILSRLYTPVNSVPGFKVNSITIGKTAGSLAASDIAIDWNEIAQFSTENITITVT